MDPRALWPRASFEQQQQAEQSNSDRMCGLMSCRALLYILLCLVLGFLAGIYVYWYKRTHRRQRCANSAADGEGVVVVHDGSGARSFLDRLMSWRKTPRPKTPAERQQSLVGVVYVSNASVQPAEYPMMPLPRTSVDSELPTYASPGHPAAARVPDADKPRYLETSIPYPPPDYEQLDSHGACSSTQGSASEAKCAP
ncbi:hypothetical protein H4R18_000184 [Coemansia javaensis]|uniref:Transmembrane protein n=1 Tax=Coemansia javaensis TaxID=2761396 RepID=A0A9W8LNE3_9FUNG|nr:hypothetical protein H4R18_000184 [Coemansia javaensis]